MSSSPAPGRKIGLLLVNLGTPNSTEVAEVRTYLKQFLSDPRVLDINPLVRWLLLTFVILRTRPKKSAEAYRSVWTAEGSPLMVHSVGLQKMIQARMPDREVVLAMRYGQPSIPDGLAKLQSKPLDELHIAPLYPQYASSSTGTVLEEVFREAAKPWNTPNLKVLPPFYREPAWLDSVAEVYRKHTADFRPDHTLFSYHGLPVRHVQKSDPTGKHCYQDPKTCCVTACEANHHCYRHQCYESTRLLVQRLGLSPEQHSVSFQSRLGKDPWVQPYTDHILPELAKRGVKRLAVLCPAFVADCLETVEEIGEEGHKQFIEAGGEDFKLVPCLNTDPLWADALVSMLNKL
jgi:ferrochelatase